MNRYIAAVLRLSHHHERFLPEGPPADFRDWIKKQHIVVRVSGICWLLLLLLLGTPLLP
eukprot:SAG22_NODE_1128_length_5460_cov_15.018280_3_plen_59_part_00